MAEPSTTEADALMSAYLDKQLAPDEAAKVEKLLAESPEAREELDGLAEHVEAGEGLPEVRRRPTSTRRSPRSCVAVAAAARCCGCWRCRSRCSAW
jgi:anti-sigma factor RsiW